MNMAREVVEVVSAHMWYRYALGVKREGSKTFGLDVVWEGRRYSYYYTRISSGQACLKKNEDDEWVSDYTAWKDGTIGDMISCCGRAGKKSSRCAETDTISPEDFATAWCFVKKCLVRFNASRPPEARLLTSGC